MTQNSQLWSFWVSNELLCLKNAGAQICFSPHMNNWQLKKSKCWGPFWSNQLDSSANSAHLPYKWAKWAKLPVLVAWLFQLPLVPNLNFSWNPLLNSDSKWMFPYKWPLYDHFWPFLAICMFIFHKTEVLTVILRCLTGINNDRFKNYDMNCKYFHLLFLKICTKTHICVFLHFLRFCVLCHNFCTNLDSDSLSTSKWPCESQFCGRYTCSCQENGQVWS